MIYLVTFSVATLLLYASSRCKGVLKTFLVAVGLLLPCLLAGFRDETIGADVLTYAKGMAINAQNMNLVEFMQYGASLANPGWNFFTWVAANVTGGLPGYLFSIEVLCIFPIYFGLRRMCKGWEWAGVLAWLLFWYAASLNGMRQCVAMSILFYSTAYVLERKPLHFLVGVIAAFLFHQTAVVGIFIYIFAFIYRYSSGISDFFGKWRSLIVFAFALSLAVVSIAFGDQIVLALSFLKESYSSMASRIGESDFSYAGMYVTIITVFLWAIARKNFISRSGECADTTTIAVTNFDTMCGIVLIGSFLWQLNLVTPHLGRIGEYGTIFLPLVIAMLGANGMKSRGVFLVSLGFMAVYFCAMTLLLGKSGVMPYTSTLLGIG